MKKLTEQLNEQLNTEKEIKLTEEQLNKLQESLSKIDEAISDDEKIALLKGEFKNALGSYIVDKATDADLLELLDLTNKREAMWKKHNDELRPINQKIDGIYSKYREDNMAIGY